MIDKIIKITERENLSFDIVFFFYKMSNNLNFYVSLTTSDLYKLQNNKYIRLLDDGNFELRVKGKELLEELKIIQSSIETKKEDSNSVINDNFITEFRKLFKATGRSGVIGDKNAIKKKLQIFINDYPEFNNPKIILAAAEKYINNEASSNYKYLQRADYFISKEDSNKIKQSRLAAFCEEVEEVEETKYNTII